MSGTLLLTHDGGPPNPGDVFSLGAAAASALYIVRLSALSAGHEAARLIAATLALSGAACMGITLAQAAAAGNLPGLALQVVARRTRSIGHARHAHAHAQRRRQHTHLHTHALQRRVMECMCARDMHALLGHPRRPRYCATAGGSCSTCPWR